MVQYLSEMNRPQKNVIQPIRTMRRGMEISWNHLPLHRRVREQILQDLVRSGLSTGVRYATENELADRFQVSRNTVRRAISGLEREGYLSRRRRVGVMIGKRLTSPVPDATTNMITTAPSRHHVFLVLPKWDDTIEGFYSGHLLRALSSPKLAPQLAIEISHHDDQLSSIDPSRDAVIAMDPNPSLALRLQNLAKKGLRVVVDAPGRPMRGVVNFLCDHRPMVRDAVKRFIGMGHRAVGLINHDTAHMNFQNALLGYLDAHRELGIPIPPQGIIQQTSYEPSPLAPEVRTISAWICTYSASLHLVAKECQRAGLSVPDDVSILSLDDTGENPTTILGKRFSVANPDYTAAAKMIHSCLTNWRTDRLGTLTATPFRWIDRETIGPPHPHSSP